MVTLFRALRLPSAPSPASPLWQIVHRAWGDFRHHYESRHRFIAVLRREKLIGEKKLRQLLNWKHSGFSLNAGPNRSPRPTSKNAEGSEAFWTQAQPEPPG